MQNSFALFRALIIYGVCLPLAIILGYLLATPLSYSTLITVGLLFAALMIPVFLTWHHPILFLTWNMVAFLPFMPGHPTFSMLACAVSLTISVLQYILNRKMTFIRVPALNRPLIYLAAVVLVTAKATGGIGFQISGGTSFGGKHYVLLLAGIAGFYALTAQPIAAEKVRLYTKLFFGGSLTMLVSSLTAVLAPSIPYIFLIFPPDIDLLYSSNGPAGAEAIGRQGTLAVAAVACTAILQSTYGVKGLFEGRRPWRLAAFLACVALATFGGFRSMLLLILAIFAIQFYLEGLMRSRIMPAIAIIGITMFALLLPFADHLPLSVQRTISFLPVKVDPTVTYDAQGSTQWRLDMWSRVWEDVPHRLLLGQGYAIDSAYIEMHAAHMDRGADSFEGAMMAGDYHSGPLSVVMPFGIWGVIGWLWFLGAGLKVVYRNYRYGEPEFKTVNTFLMAYFITKSVFFFGVMGSLYSDMIVFTGVLGLSVCINNGMREPARQPVPGQPVFNKFKAASRSAR